MHNQDNIALRCFQILWNTLPDLEKSQVHYRKSNHLKFCRDDKLLLSALLQDKVLCEDSSSGRFGLFLPVVQQILQNFTKGEIISSFNQWVKNSFRFEGHFILPLTLAKAYVVGRKAWLFSDTVEGAEASAVFFSLINTIKANGLEPYWYLRYLLEKMTFMKSLDKESLIPLMPQNTDASVIEEFRRNNSNQNIDFTTPVRIIYENGIFKPANQ